MKEIKLYLIRHGKTYCNEQRLYYGKSDVNLCEAGVKELIEKKNNIIYPECEFYFTSGAKRANETLEIIYPGVKYKILEKLFEYDFGEFELKSYEDLKDKKEYVDWINDDEGHIKCPNGESKFEFKKRVIEGFNELIKYLKKEHITTALGVTHGGSIGIILETMYDNSLKFYEWQPKNGEGYELIIQIKDNGEFNIERIQQFGVEINKN